MYWAIWNGTLPIRDCVLHRLHFDPIANLQVNTWRRLHQFQERAKVFMNFNEVWICPHGLARFLELLGGSDLAVCNVAVPHRIKPDAWCECQRVERFALSAVVRVRRTAIVSDQLAL